MYIVFTYQNYNVYFYYNVKFFELLKNVKLKQKTRSTW